MEEWTRELDQLLNWAAWVGLVACVAGIYLAWCRWRNIDTIVEPSQRIIVIMICAGLIANAGRIATWMV